MAYKSYLTEKGTIQFIKDEMWELNSNINAEMDNPRAEWDFGPSEVNGFDGLGWGGECSLTVRLMSDQGGGCHAVVVWAYVDGPIDVYLVGVRLGIHSMAAASTTFAARLNGLLTLLTRDPLEHYGERGLADKELEAYCRENGIRALNTEPDNKH